MVDFLGHDERQTTVRPKIVSSYSIICVLFVSATTQRRGAVISSFDFLQNNAFAFCLVDFGMELQRFVFAPAAAIQPAYILR
jgi:hypothetical protein